jgi:LmbE family N-acetylglucosaminyl deacetylase
MISSPHTLLAVLAHPDDESFGMGGTLALYSQRGYKTHLICATRGEVGEMDPQLLVGFSSISDRRESELRCAAGMLGLAGVYFLDYRDSGMAGSPDNQHPNALAAQPVEAVASKVAHFIRHLRPEVVVTFDPIGGYKHPDHIAIHKATVYAFTLASDASHQDDLPPYQARKLYFHTISKNYLRLAVGLLRLLGKNPHHFGRNHDIDLAAIVEDGSFPIHARINCRSVAKVKESAAACHASQLGSGPPQRGLISMISRQISITETFMRAIPPPPDRLIETDLFVGL